MLASFLLLVSLSQDGATPTPFLWNIEGMGDPKSLIVVTISLTPYGLGNGIEVETISLDPLPTRDDPKPRAIPPLKTEPAPALRSGWRERGLRAWFTPPGRRFHLIVTLSNGSTHRIDIYRRVPPSKPTLMRPPIDRTIPMWTTHEPAASEWSSTLLPLSETEIVAIVPQPRTADRPPSDARPIFSPQLFPRRGPRPAIFPLPSKGGGDQP